LNNCYFTGFFTEKPDLISVDGVSFVEFTLAIHSYRKTKNGEKTKNTIYLAFEAWHTGAETIAKLAKQGTKITVQASAKPYSNNEYEDCINFRVNEFDFSCLD
jgi:single-stranded DNA-binding protein